MKKVIDENGNKFVYDSYVYVLPIASLGNGASLTANIGVEADSNFVWIKSAYFADIAGAAQTDSSRVIPLVNVAITDTGSGRSLQSEAVPIACYGGHGGLPLVLPVAREFKANSTIQATFTNFSAATTYANLKLCLIGYKKFAY